MTDLAYLTIAEAAALLRDRKLSPVEYVRALLDRAGEHDGLLNAYLRRMDDAAIAAAREAEAEIGRGNWKGPMHGVPFGLKDIVDVAGVPTTAHSKILADNVAKSDAEVTRRLKAAGGVLTGKLSTHEFALGGPSFDLPWPPARNPWNRDHHPGGSSSGSGSGLAAGFFPAAIGTDTGGSVRNPASCNGIVGLKATYGRVSRAGVIPLSFSLDHVGPMTRTVEDNAIMLNVIAGHDPADPGSAKASMADFTSDLEKGVKGLKIGVVRHFYTRDLEADPEMAKSIEDALDLLAREGAEIREVKLSPLQDYATCNRIILMSEAYAIHEKWLQERPEDYGALCRNRITAGAFYRAVDYVKALRWRGRLVRELNEAMADLDVVITASSMEPPAPIEQAEEVERTYPRQARAPFNLTGSPALALPTGFSSAGMPLSMQIVGKAFDEAMVYRVGRAYERATEWTGRHPTLSKAA